jgi:spermidine synthase
MWQDRPAVRSTDAPSRGQGFGVLAACFFLSGATGLVYQVVWLRLLGLIVGHTVYAITAVLAAFMAGLALGSFIFARRAGRIRHLVAAYGWLEIGIGVYCALIPLLLWLGSFVYLYLHRALGLSYGAFSVVQFLVAFLLLLVPTTLMGGTLPVLSQALVTGPADLARRVGLLYAINTFGAVAGVALAGYLLLPALGNRVTIAVAAIANLAVGTLALLYSRRRQAAPISAPEPEPPRRPSAPRARVAGKAPARAAAAVPAQGPAIPRLSIWLTVAALGVSGAVSMIYEVAWTRALTLVIGSSTYAFTAMLLAFLVGIAGGSALFSWLWGARRASAAVFAVLQAALAISVMVILALFEQFPALFLTVLSGSGGEPALVQLTQIVISALALLPATLLIGATFPCAVAVAAREPGRVGKDVGNIYAVNTVGAIAGTVLVGFGLIPVFGVHASIKIGIILNLLLALGLFLAPSRLALGWAGAAVAAAAGVVVALIPAWDQRVMVSGPAIYAPLYLEEAGAGGLAEVLRRPQLVFYRDGISATVAVEKQGKDLALRINGKADASTNRPDMSTQILLAALPLLSHPDPRDVLIIGLGSGITAGAAARHVVERIDVAEIEPAVVEASRFFAETHGKALDNPRVHIVLADARNFLLTTARRYDVIIAAPSNPWISGLASLFSLEYFELCRQRLKPGGIMIQWAQGYNLLPEDMQMVVRTFRAVFPATSLWHTGAASFLLLGRTDPSPLDLVRIKARYEASAGVRDDLARIGVSSWPGILGYFMLDAGGVGRLAAGTGLNTDDRLPLEFRAPRALYVETGGLNLGRVRSARGSDVPEVTAGSRGELERAEARHAIALVYANRNLWEEALGQFQRAVELDPASTPALLGVSLAQIRLGQPREALATLQRVLQRERGNAEALAQAGVAHGALGEQAQASEYLERAVALQPRNQGYLDLLAQARARARAPAATGASPSPTERRR